jgi:hypothetical protein
LQVSVQSGLLFVVQDLRRRASGQDEATHHHNGLQDVDTPVPIAIPTPEQETHHGSYDSHTTLLLPNHWISLSADNETSAGELCKVNNQRGSPWLISERAVGQPSRSPSKPG